MPFIFLGIIVLGAAYVLKRAASPNIVYLPPIGPVIFNPAPPTGSNTFLGSITGIPGMYWNVTTQISDIPSGFINPNITEAGTPMVNIQTTTPYSMAGGNVPMSITESYYAISPYTNA